MHAREFHARARPGGLRMPSLGATARRVAHRLLAVVVLLLAPCLLPSAASAGATFDWRRASHGFAPQVAAGCSHSVMLRSDGTVLTWGSNASGQLGTGSVGGSSATPVTVLSGASPLNGVKAVAAGCDFSAALLANGSVMTWGAGSEQQLGTGSAAATGSPAAVRVNATTTLQRVTAIAAGSRHVVATRSDGSLWAWGDNARGQIGDGGAPTDATYAVQVRTDASTTLAKVVAAAAGDSSSYAVASNGTARAWGAGSDGQLGNGGVVDEPYAVTIRVDASTPLDSVVAVDAGGSFAVARRADGSAWTWGSNALGQLGTGGGPASSAWALPVRRDASTPLVRVVGLAAGRSHAAAITSNGQVVAWGDNAAGQVGTGSVGGTSAWATPVLRLAATPLAGAVRITGGAQHTVVTRHDGSAWGWGSDAAGQLGDGTSGGSNPYAQAGTATAGTGFAAQVGPIGGSYGRGVALRGDGTVWMWGFANDGQLALGGYNNWINFPVQPRRPDGTPVAGVKAIASSGTATYALRHDGSVDSWGYGMQGQTGTGAFEYTWRAAPVVLAGGTPLDDVVALSASDRMGAAVRSDGTLWTWGHNQYGELADGTLGTNQNVARQARFYGGPVVTGATALAGGTWHGLLIDSAGGAWSWGRNDAGQLGVGTGPDLPGLVQVRIDASTPLIDIVDISAGDIHSLAIDAGGVPWGWGANGEYQLATGNTTSRPWAGRLRFDSTTIADDTIDVHANRRQGLLLRSDGTPRTWGANVDGVLAQGDFASRAWPSTMTLEAGGTPASIVSVHSAGEYASMLLQSKGLTLGAGNNARGQLSDCTYTGRTRLVEQQLSCPAQPPLPPLHALTKRADSGASISVNGWTNQLSVKLSAMGSDPDNTATMTSWFELVPEGTPFSGTCGIASATVQQGPSITAPLAGAAYRVDHTWAGLTDNTRYEWRACFVDAEGVAGPWGAPSSTTWEFGVDTVSPLAPTTVLDGLAADLSEATSMSELSANWSGSSDNFSGVQRSEYCIGTAVTASACSGTVVRAWTSAGSATQVTATGLALANATTYYTCVRTVDHATNVSATITCSDGQATPSLTIASLTPSSLPQGIASKVVRIAGTGFQAPPTVAVSGTGVTVLSVTMVDMSTVDVAIRVAASAATGARTVTLTNPNASSATGTLTVASPSLTISLSSLGYESGSRTVGGDVSFGQLLGGDRAIGPTGSGQRTDGPAIRATIGSDTDWQLLVRAADFTGPQPLTAGALAWRPSGTSTWTAMAATDAAATSSRSPTAPGTSDVDFDLQVVVPASQQAGSYQTTVTYTVVAAP